MSSRRASAGLLWLLTLLCLSDAVVARADTSSVVSPNEQAARASFEAGRQAYEHGDFGAALLHFERSYAQSPRPELLYNIGRAADADGEPVRALAAYSAYLEVAADANNRDFVSARLLKMRALVEQQRSETRALPTVAESETEPGLLTAARPATRNDEPHARSFWRRPWVWVALGTLVAGAVTASLLATRSNGPERYRADAYSFTPEPL